MASQSVMHDSVALAYLDAPREQYQNLPDNPVYSVAQTPVSTFSADAWNPHTRLLRVGIKASDRAVADLAPANLVFLVDVSGSMDRREGLPLVKSTPPGLKVWYLLRGGV